MLRILILLSFAFILTSGKRESQFLMITKQHFKVNVSTSFGDFQCEHTSESKDTLFYKSSGKISRLEYIVPTQSFRCGNFILNNDFQKTLKSETYPVTTIILSDIVVKGNEYHGKVYLNIVGKELFFNDFVLYRNKNNLSGQITVSFTDLELPAPRKMGGLLKVRDAIQLNISLLSE